MITNKSGQQYLHIHQEQVLPETASETMKLEKHTSRKQPLKDYVFYYLTSRDRPKSAPYPRLKNTKKTSKCQVYSFTVLENRIFFEKNFRKNYILKKWTEWRAGLASASPWRAKVSMPKN